MSEPREKDQDRIKDLETKLASAVEFIESCGCACRKNAREDYICSKCLTLDALGRLSEDKDPE